MKAWNEVVVSIGACTLSLTVCATLLAQKPAAQFTGSSGVGTTVSVASLRIPERAWQHFTRAKSLSAKNQFAESEAESQRAIAIAPQFVDAYLLRASAELREHRFEAAIASVTEAQRIEPEAMWARELLASAYNGLHRYTEAEAVLNAMHGSEAQTWQAAYEHARAAIGLADVPAALRWSAAALASAPAAFGDAYLVRANSLILAKRWAEAASQMEAYLQRSDSIVHRLEVSGALEAIKRHLREEDHSQMALR